MGIEREEINRIINSKKIDSKKKSYLLYEGGFFGNKVLTWNSLQEIKESGWKNKICIRSRKGIARGKTKFDIPLEELDKNIKEMIEDGMKIEELFFNQSMPNESLTLQGEITLTEKGIYLLYTLIKKPMNLGLKEQSLHAFGFKAKAILEHFLSPICLDEIYLLLNNFPESIIEFSTYSCPVGNLPNRNTVIWEVRNY